MKVFSYKNINIIWTGHDGFRVQNDFILYFDPYQLNSPQPADIILITHEHFDHFSEKDISKIISSKTLLICPYELEDKASAFPSKNVFLRPWEEYKTSLSNISVKAIPAYNINKFRAPGIPFHPKEDNKLGYVVSIAGIKIYHAGDTDNIPEMKKLRELKIDIALLPVSGTYVMTPEEAAEAAEIIEPKVAIPMHWGAIVAGRKEAEKFKKLVESKGIQVVIPEKE